MLIDVFIYWLSGIQRYGWLFMVGHLVPVSFIQDVSMKNGGYDILTIKRNQGYYTGKFQNNPYYK